MISSQNKNSILTVVKACSLVAAYIFALATIEPSNPGFFGVEPHPYWFAAIAAGLFLGRKGAIPASLLLSVAYLWFIRSRADRDELETLLTAGTLALPFAMLLVSAVIGSLVDRSRTDSARLESNIEQRDRTIVELEEARRQGVRESERVERRLSLQSRTAIRFFEHARQLETLDISGAAKALVDLVGEQVGEKNVYLYLRDVESDGITRLAYLDSGSAAMPEKISGAELKNYPLLERVILGGKLARMDELGNESERELSVAAPLVTLSDDVIGVIALRKVDFLNYVPPTFASLESLARWGGTCLARVHRVSRLQEESLVDDITGFFNFSYFQRRLDAQFAQAKKHSLPLHQVRFEVPELSSGDALQRTALTKLVSDCIRGPSRDVDVIARGVKEGVFHAILPIASDGETAAFVEGVKKEFIALSQRMEGGIALNLNCYSSAIKREHASTQDLINAEVRLT